MPIADASAYHGFRQTTSILSRLKVASEKVLFLNAADTCSPIIRDSPSPGQALGGDHGTILNTALAIVDLAISLPWLGRVWTVCFQASRKKPAVAKMLTFQS